MNKLCIELSVCEASALYRLLKNSKSENVVDKHIAQDIMNKIKRYMGV